VIQDDPNYIIILQELDTHETEALFRHTRRLREGRSHEGSESSDTSDSEPVVVRFRPRLGSQPTKIRVSIDTRVQQPSLQHNLALTNFRHDVTARRARKCRYYGDHPVLPTAEPTFKCVQYATYGDLTRDSTDKMRSPPGLVTASQHQCSVHATLYHVLYVQRLSVSPYVSIVTDTHRHLQLDIMDYDNFKVPTTSVSRLFCHTLLTQAHVEPSSDIAWIARNSRQCRCTSQQSTETLRASAA
jgi:hypothetical protein